MGLSKGPIRTSYAPPEPQTGGRNIALSSFSQTVGTRQICQCTAIKNSLTDCEMMSQTVVHFVQLYRKERPLIRAKYVGSSSGLITIAVLTLLALSSVCSSATCYEACAIPFHLVHYLLLLFLIILSVNLQKAKHFVA